MKLPSGTHPEIKDKLIVLLVLCSMSEDRFKIAKEVVKSISEFFETTNCKLWVLDNGSKFKVANELYPKGSSIINFTHNIGYWGALHWFLNSGSSPIFRVGKEYLYIVESDHIHFNMHKLKNVMSFMDTNPKIKCTRVQEFSIRKRIMYSKEARYLPFRRKRSIISLRDHVTNKKAWFQRTGNDSQVYFSNLHSRLPSVFRLESLQSAFQELAEFENFSEEDFYKVMHNFSPTIGVLNGGIFFPASSYSNSHLVQSGSWGRNYSGDMTNYIPTRISSLSKNDLNPIISDVIEK